MLAVRKITAAGNRVVFDDEEGDYILNKPTGLTTTKIHKRNGTYIVNVWVLVPTVHTGMFNALGDESEEQQVFPVGA